MNPKAIAIIQARSSSSRLPGKVLKLLAGQPMIWHIVQRARACAQVDRVVVATSVEPSDDALASFCNQAGIDCHRGSLANVLSRYLAVLEQYDHPYFVRITGDCPLIHPPFIDRQIEALIAHDADLVRCDAPSTLLEGQGACSTRSLRKVAQASDHPDDQEHVGARYYAEHPEAFQVVGLQLPPHLQDIRWRLTVDEAADHQMMATLYEALYQGQPIKLEAVVDYLQRHPEVAAINRRVEHSAINQELTARRAAQQPPLVGTLPW